MVSREHTSLNSNEICFKGFKTDVSQINFTWGQTHLLTIASSLTFGTSLTVNLDDHGRVKF